MQPLLFVVLSLMVLVAVWIGVKLAILHRKAWSAKQQHLVFTERLLEYLDQHSRTGTITNVINRDAGSQSHASLYGVDLVCHMSWPTNAGSDPQGEPAPVFELDGRIMLHDDVELLGHVPLLGLPASNAGMLAFIIHADPHPDQEIRLRHGVSCHLRITDRAEVHILYDKQEWFGKKLLSWSRHDEHLMHLLEAFHSAVRTRA